MPYGIEVTRKHDTIVDLIRYRDVMLKIVICSKLLLRSVTYYDIRRKYISKSFHDIDDNNENEFVLIDERMYSNLRAVFG